MLGKSIKVVHVRAKKEREDRNRGLEKKEKGSLY